MIVETMLGEQLPDGPFRDGPLTFVGIPVELSAHRAGPPRVHAVPG